MDANKKNVLEFCNFTGGLNHPALDVMEGLARNYLPGYVKDKALKALLSIRVGARAICQENVELNRLNDNNKIAELAAEVVIKERDRKIRELETRLEQAKRTEVALRDEVLIKHRSIRDIEARLEDSKDREANMQGVINAISKARLNDIEERDINLRSLRKNLCKAVDTLEDIEQKAEEDLKRSHSRNLSYNTSGTHYKNETEYLRETIRVIGLKAQASFIPDTIKVINFTAGDLTPATKGARLAALKAEAERSSRIEAEVRDLLKSKRKTVKIELEVNIAGSKEYRKLLKKLEAIKEQAQRDVGREVNSLLGKCKE